MWQVLSDKCFIFDSLIHKKSIGHCSDDLANIFCLTLLLAHMVTHFLVAPSIWLFHVGGVKFMYVAEWQNALALCENTATTYKYPHDGQIPIRMGSFDWMHDKNKSFVS